MKEQLDLFGAAPNVEVEPIVDEGARAIAARLPAWLRFGTSSWTFPGWAGIVYAGAPTEAQLVASGLAAYARHPLLRTVGIDRSYYGPLTREDLARYAAQLPPDFLAVSKVWEELTTFVFPRQPRFGARAGAHNPRFLDPQATLDEVIAPYADAFSAHAGPFVFELAPIPKHLIDEPRILSAIDRLLAALPSRFRYAFELRTRELLTPRYLDVLRAHRAAHVVNYWTAMPSIGEQLRIPGVLTSDFVVARLLLPPGTRYEDKKNAFAPFDRIVAPQPALRDDVVALARACAAKGASLFVLVNNKAEGSSPLTIRTLAELISRLL